MTVHYTFSSAMTITFDGQYELHIRGSLDDAREAIEVSFNAYHFCEAFVILDGTGEIIMTCLA